LIVGEREAVAHAFLAKRGMERAPGKEIPECLAQLDDRHLRRILGDIEHPWKLRALDRVQLPAQCALRWLRQTVVDLPRLVLALPFRQRPVVGETRRAGGARQVRGLLVVRGQTDLVGS
jgi:hypothetical protein